MNVAREGLLAMAGLSVNDVYSDTPAGKQRVNDPLVSNLARISGQSEDLIAEIMDGAGIPVERSGGSV